MRKLSYLLALPLLALAACSQGDDLSENGLPGQDAAPVTFNITRAAADAYQSVGINEMTLLVYERKDKEWELIINKKLNATDDSFTFVPKLGLNFRTVVFANADKVSGIDDPATLKFEFNDDENKPVFCSTMTSFASDKSTSSVSLALKRIESRVNFAPVEEAADLAANTRFDKIVMKFTNTADVYYPGSGNANAISAGFGKDMVVTTTAAEGYKASFRTFATNATKVKWNLYIDFFKGDQLVKQSDELESEKLWQGNYNYNIMLNLLSDDILVAPWDDAAARPSIYGHNALKLIVNEI